MQPAATRNQQSTLRHLSLFISRLILWGLPFCFEESHENPMEPSLPDVRNIESGKSWKIIFKFKFF